MQNYLNQRNEIFKAFNCHHCNKTSINSNPHIARGAYHCSEECAEKTKGLPLSNRELTDCIIHLGECIETLQQSVSEILTQTQNKQKESS